MRPLSVVIAQKDSNSSEVLIKSLWNHFRVVHAAHDLNELRSMIPQHRIDVAVVDLELADLAHIKQLKHEFAEIVIVCTHRLADESMWVEALAAGAADCCHSSDVRSIVLAVTSTKLLPHSHAA
ncbi:MAG TPA: hypothetical protein VKZ53_13430 [Candidatus Angelobacter sp.]|nr:hypothetical protein [Candidatus Angelobacter sp.]